MGCDRACTRFRSNGVVDSRQPPSELPRDHLMNRTNIIRGLSLATVATLATATLCADAHADIYINSDVVKIEGFKDTAAGVRYRMSNSNWDMALENGKGTSKSSNFISTSLGNNKQLSERTYAFTLTHLAGQGFIWQVTDVGDKGKTDAMGWGKFDEKVDGTVKSELNGMAPGASFNTILVDARATLSGSSMAFDDLKFNGDLKIADGSFDSGVIDPSTIGRGDAKGYWSQTLASSTDLSKSDWSLTGLLHGQRSGSGGDEEVRFNITMRDASVSIPAPGALAVMALAGLFSRVGSRRSSRD